MGLSLPGMLVSVAVLAPNLLLLAWPPRDAVRVRHAGRLATVLERAGQVGCLALPVLTGSNGAFDVWLVGVALAIAVYWGLWARYLRRGRRIRSLYGPIAGVPVPMAATPVAIFGLAAAWLGSPWTGATAAVLAAGHIPNSLAAAKGLGLHTVTGSR